MPNESHNAKKACCFDGFVPILIYRWVVFSDVVRGYERWRFHWEPNISVLIFRNYSLLQWSQPENVDSFIFEFLLQAPFPYVLQNISYKGNVEDRLEPWRQRLQSAKCTTLMNMAPHIPL